MRLSRGPFLILHTLALIVILVKGRVREVDALIQKPKALKPGPLPATWTRNTNTNINSNSNHQRIANTNRIAQNYNNNNNARQHERSEKSMRVKMAGNMPAFQSENKVLKRRLLFATALAGVLYLKPKGLLLFLSNGLYKPYQNSLVTNPLVTKVVTGAILSIIGDGVAQASSSDEIPYDKRRALSFAVFDSCYRVFQHNMFPAIIRAGKGNVVGKLLPMLAPAAAAIEQTAMYQFLVVPLIYYPAFFTFTGLLQGLSVRQSMDRLKAQFFRCWRRNLMFWIPMQMVLFGLIAENWQIPFACVAGMVWSTILSKTAGSTK